MLTSLSGHGGGEAKNHRLRWPSKLVLPMDGATRWVPLLPSVTLMTSSVQLFIFQRENVYTHKKWVLLSPRVPRELFVGSSERGTHLLSCERSACGQRK